MDLAGSSARAHRIDLDALLDRIATVSPVEAIDVMVDELAGMLRARSGCFLIADLSGRLISRFGGTDWNAARRLQEGARHALAERLPGTDYERVLRDQRVEVVAAPGGGSMVMVPVTDRGDAIGVLELELADAPDEQLIAGIVAAARTLAYVAVACRRHTDLFEWAQRTLPFTLAAEIQRRLLPTAFTCETGQFTVSGWLEPANAVGGDTFDYAIDRDTLHVSITDAVGHDVNAATLATILVASLRNGRRRGADLLDQAATANDALAAHSTVGQFVTGQLVRVDRATATATFVNAGHPFPLRLRDGRVEEIELDIDMPFGLEPGRSFRPQPVPLLPGDRILLITDGMYENDERVDLNALIERTAGLHSREVVHLLGDEVLRASGGELRDDATTVCIDWHGGPPGGRVDDLPSARSAASES
ncbi:PP2C family protein-serine/threonine phosphatase [Pseudonocardia humida]|uniref:Serine/threonine-protein phosphatase n=1 Tax=Pseudonocardia humida TaxID=2800819 RepID=A0ABT1A6M8_9PSEU|nr:PP2C family protein-serine/threonine phosphatase [Pseudonocardia humida]MCO1658672.1 serine/threonine-protein phosphatase [Pseudonocardia humida]